MRHTPWSPELSLVAVLARLQPTQPALERASALAAGSLDWDRILQLATRHRVAPLVHANASRLEGGAVPERVLEHLGHLRRHIVATNLRKYGEWLQTCRMLADEGLEVLTLKGFHLALAVYGDAGRRAVGDLDLLVREKELPRALACLERAGWTLYAAEAEAIRNVGLDRVARRNNHVSLHSNAGTEVELHWRLDWLAGSIPLERIWNAPDRMSVGAQDVLVPSADAALALMLVHGHNHSWSRLSWLVDVAETLDQRRARGEPGRPDVGWAPGSDRGWEAATWLVDGLWGHSPTRSSHPVEERPRTPPRAHAYLRSRMEAAQESPLTTSVRATAHVVFGYLAIGSAPLGVLALMVRPGVPDWSVVRLPRGLRWGYYLVRALRILLWGTIGTPWAVPPVGEGRRPSPPVTSGSASPGEGS